MSGLGSAQGSLTPNLPLHPIEQSDSEHNLMPFSVELRRCHQSRQQSILLQPHVNTSDHWLFILGICRQLQSVLRKYRLLFTYGDCEPSMSPDFLLPMYLIWQFLSCQRLEKMFNLCQCFLNDIQSHTVVMEQGATEI